MGSAFIKVSYRNAVVQQQCELKVESRKLNVKKVRGFHCKSLRFCTTVTRVHLLHRQRHTLSQTSTKKFNYSVKILSEVYL